jgi:hypothetical protein
VLSLPAQPPPLLPVSPLLPSPAAPAATAGQPDDTAGPAWDDDAQVPTLSPVPRPEVPAARRGASVKSHRACSGRQLMPLVSAGAYLSPRPLLVGARLVAWPVPTEPQPGC